MITVKIVTTAAAIVILLVNDTGEALKESNEKGPA